MLSAGVGRTGTFIGLDSLLKQGRETGKINVFEFVKQMREDRMTMVQTQVKNNSKEATLISDIVHSNAISCDVVL